MDQNYLATLIINNFWAFLFYIIYYSFGDQSSTRTVHTLKHIHNFILPQNRNCNKKRGGGGYQRILLCAATQTRPQNTMRKPKKFKSAFWIHKIKIAFGEDLYPLQGSCLSSISFFLNQSGLICEIYHKLTLNFWT